MPCARCSKVRHEPVTRNEFEAFTRPLLADNSAIATLSWVPRVLNSERAQHERAAVSQGLTDYRIKAMNADGKMTLSPEHSEYYPVFYATVPKTSSLYGLDLRSEPPTLAEMDHARDVDRLAFSQVRTLVSTGGIESGYLFSLPIYKQWIASRHDRGSAPQSHRFRSRVAKYRQDGQYDHHRDQNAERAQLVLLPAWRRAGRFAGLRPWLAAAHDRRLYR